MIIQREIEKERPHLIADMLEISEQKAVQNGWDSFAQQQYFENIENNEDLSFNANGQRRVAAVQAIYDEDSEIIDIKSYNPGEQAR